MDSDASLGGSGSPQPGRRTRPIFLAAISNTRLVSNTGRYTLFGTGVRHKRSLHLLSRNSSLHDCETRDWAGHELHSYPPYRHSSDSRVQPLACVPQASRSSIERAACAFDHFRDDAAGSSGQHQILGAEQTSRADQSSRSGTSVRLPQATGLVRSADVAIANGDDRVLGRICLTSFCWAS